MDDKTKGLLIAAVVGLALAYYLNTSSAEASPLSPNGGLLPPGGGGDVGGGGAPPAPPVDIETGKPAAYGIGPVQVYQKRLKQFHDSMKTTFAQMPGFFAETGISDPGAIDGKWGPKTEKASQALMRIGKKAWGRFDANDKVTPAGYIDTDPAALAHKYVLTEMSANGRSKFFPFVEMIGKSSTEPGLVQRIYTWDQAGGFITKADWWALAGGTEVNAKRNLPRPPYSSIK
jgi:hypothetical protein